MRLAIIDGNEKCMQMINEAYQFFIELIQSAIVQNDSFYNEDEKLQLKQSIEKYIMKKIYDL